MYVFYFLVFIFVAEWWGRLEIRLYMEKDTFDNYFCKEHALGIMNHTYLIDWLAGMLMIDKKGNLGVSIIRTK